MNFRSRKQEEPEINLIPFIDVLLVILIFLMLSTSYSKFTELPLKLPLANVDALRDYPKEVRVGVTSEGDYSVNQQALAGHSVNDLSRALKDAGGSDTIVVIHADASARHQSVIRVMEAAQRVGLTKISFAAQNSGGTTQ